MSNIIDITDTVTFTNEEKDASLKNKKKAHKAITLQGVYRESIVLLTSISEIAMRTSRKLIKLTDQSMEIVSSIIKAECLAYELYGQEKEWSITDALALVQALKAHLAVYRTRGIITQDEFKKIQGVCRGISSQLLGWRNSIKNNNPAGS